VTAPSDEPARATSPVGARFFVWSATPVGLVSLFAVGLLLRLWLARGGGFPFDMSSFAGWAARLAQKGPWHFYPGPGEKFFVDYPPGYLYILYGLGGAARAAGEGVPPVFWLKLPPILGDLGLAWLVGVLATRLAPRGRLFPVRGVAVAAILLNPAIFFVSAVWGQADSVFALLLVGAFILLGDPDATLGREAGGAALLAAAIITKPQALFVVPIVVLLLAWRHLRATRGPARSLSLAASGVSRLALVGGAGLVTGVALAAPFRMWPAKAVSFYAAAAKTYPMTSVFAFNFWGAVGFWRPDSGAQAVRVFGLPAGVVGLAVFVVVVALVLVRAWRALESGNDEGRALVFGGIAITLVAFATLTRIHERYLYVAIPLLAALVWSRRTRWALGVVSALFLINVYFPYVYYLRYVHRRAPDLGGLFDAFYGRDIAGPRMRFLALATGTVAIGLAAAGWRWLAADGHGAVGSVLPTTAPTGGVGAAEPKPSWTLRLHPVGRRGALLALGVFAVAFVSRVAGLGHPPGMYFDEVYHARTGAEYLNHKEVYEWTHPPLAKEIIALDIKELSHFHATPVVALPAGASPSLIASTDTGNVWAVPDAGGANLETGAFGPDCRLRPLGHTVHVDVKPEAIAASDGHVFIAGVGPTGRAVVRLDGGREAWRAAIDGRVRTIAPIGDAAYVLQDDGTLAFVAATGVPTPVATRATSLGSSTPDGLAWAGFADPPRVASWSASGKRTAVISVRSTPRDIAVPETTKRLVVADSSADRVEVVDTEGSNVSATIVTPASFAGTVPETQLGWAAGARSMVILEPRGGSVIGRVVLPATAQSIVADPHAHRMVAVTPGGVSCVGGRPTFAWRFGSAVMGSLAVAFVALLALRLFGSLAMAALAGLFLAVDGLVFTISRIAMNDSYVMGLMLVAWFCVLSALYAWGRGSDEWGPRSRPAALGWLAGAGIFCGLAVATKWVGLYALVAIGVLVLWDMAARGRDGILGVAGSPLASIAFAGVVFGVVPLGLYLASYVPYFSLGHSFHDFVQLQQQMYAYHAYLKATHPFGSRWYGWPFGHKAVFLYLADHVTKRSEIWTIPNIVVAWGGLVGMGAAVVRAGRTRAVALVILVGAALAQYLPWAAVSRVTFLYHYLPVVPFLAIALAWWLIEGLRGYRYRWVVIVGVTLAAVAFFFAVLPALEGWAVSASILNTIRRSLPWILPP